MASGLERSIGAGRGRRIVRAPEDVKLGEEVPRLIIGGEWSNCDCMLEDPTVGGEVLRFEISDCDRVAMDKGGVAVRGSVTVPVGALGVTFRAFRRMIDPLNGILNAFRCS
jgi:hypothetical protein